jgi:membrane protease YdiL (CAAX protease family)
LVEHTTDTGGVPGSNPGARTVKSSRYYVIAIVIYAVLIPALVVWGGFRIDYSFDPSNRPALLVFVISAAIFGAFVARLSKGKTRLGLRHVLLSLAYATVFAVLEEAFFRGIIQTFIETRLESPYVIVFLSSAIYALAHWFNQSRHIVALSFLAGLPLGATFLITDSLILPTILHAVFIAGLRLLEAEQPSK